MPRGSLQAFDSSLPDIRVERAPIPDPSDPLVSRSYEKLLLVGVLDVSSCQSYGFTRTDRAPSDIAARSVPGRSSS